MTRTSEPTTPLGIYVKERLEKLGVEPTIRALSRRSEISVMSASRIWHGDYNRGPDEKTLQSVSSNLGVPLTKLRQLAGRPSGERAPFVPPAEFDQLNQRQREVLVSVGRALLDASKGATGADEQPNDPPAFRLVGRARQPED